MFSFDQAEPRQQYTSPQQQPQQNEKTPETTRPKRPRASLACIRCRKKKVKCDFIQPTCTRCSTAGLPCSYATPPRRVDGQAFDQLGGHVEELKERMQRIQSELVMMKSNVHPISAGGPTIIHRHPDTRSFETQHQPQQQQIAMATQQQPVTWKLSLSPSGLRIDTNIASVADLYRILLNGISQLNISGDSATSLFSMDSLREGTGKQNPGLDTKTSRTSRAWGRYAKYRSFSNHRSVGAIGAMDHALVPSTSTLEKNIASPSSSSAASSPGRLWEVNENEARIILQEKQLDDTMNQDTLTHLVSGTYHSCFLAYQIADQRTFNQLYAQNGLDPLLANSLNAWLSKHGCIFHGACVDKDPSTMGEAYFKNARQLLKKCFDISSPTTIHALINLYMYQLSCERSSLAYLYIGLAIRMAQDLKFHKKEFMPADPVLKEANKRLWWTAYWLDLCAALESNRPTMVDDKDCDLEYPTKLDCEDDETGYRIGFAVYSIKLMKVRKDITKHLPSEQSGQSLLSAISRLENSLTHWLQDLPIDLHLESDEPFNPTGSFRDEACLILNIQYQTTWIMLHKFFLPKKHQTSTPVALLSLNICTKSANFITKMLDLYRHHLPWCQFFYALDGVMASVTIHQVNAMSTEHQVAQLAQRNLIVTADILRQSPLIYMEKVNEIVESIERFFKKNQMPIHDLPVVNEDSINQQCLSSVFHPDVFEQASASSTFIPQQPAFDPSASLAPSNNSLPQQQGYNSIDALAFTPILQAQYQSSSSPSSSSLSTPLQSQYQQSSSSSSSTPLHSQYQPSSSSSSSSSPSPAAVQQQLQQLQQQQSSTLLQSHYQQQSSEPLASMPVNQFLFGPDMLNDQRMHFGTNGSLSGGGNNMDQFLFGADFDPAPTTLMDHHHHHHLSTPHNTEPFHSAITATPITTTFTLDSYHQQQHHPHLQPSTTYTTAMNTHSLHDILYGDALAQQESLLSTPNTIANSTITTTTNITLDNTNASSNTTTNNTLSAGGFDLLEPKGQKRPHREWDSL